jgi:hypothetical protein
MNFELIIGIVFSIYIITTIFELVKLHRFDLKYFNYGFKIFKKVIDHKFSNWNNLDGIYEEKEGKYVFLPEMKIGYFITKFRFFKSYSLIAHSSGLPLTIFGKFEEIENKLIMTYFISYRLVILISMWLIIWTVLPIMTGKLLGFAIGIGGILFTLLILYVVNMFQQGKMLIMSDEVSKILKIKKIKALNNK